MQTINKKGVLILGFIIFALGLWQPNAALAQWLPNPYTSGNIYFNGGNVGIGTSSPSTKLDVVGTVNASTAVVSGALVALGSGGLTLSSGSIYSGGTSNNLFFGNVGLGNASPAANLHIGNDTDDVTGAIFQLPSDVESLSTKPMLQWQGGSGYGKWRNYFNSAEKGFILTYNMPYSYATNDFQNRDVGSGANSAAYIWYDGLEGAYNFWSIGFGAPGATNTVSDLDEAGRILFTQGSNGDGSGNFDDVVPTVWQLTSPSNANATYRLIAGRGQTTVELTAEGSSTDVFKIVGYTDPGDIPYTIYNTTGTEAHAHIDLLTIHTTTGEIEYTPVSYSNLGTPNDGTVAYCNDCKNMGDSSVNPAGSVCQSSGTGSFAKRLHGAWRCN